MEIKDKINVKEKKIRELLFKKGDKVWFFCGEGSRLGKIIICNENVFNTSHNNELVYFTGHNGGYNPECVFNTKKSLIFSLENIIDEFKKDDSGTKSFKFISEEIYNKSVNEAKEKAKAKAKAKEQAKDESTK